METYQHRVYGIYATRKEAMYAHDDLLQAGFMPEQIEVVDAQHPPRDITPDSDEVRNEILIDGAIGTAAGAGIGALGEAALAAANISLFIASPVIGTLTMIGWGAAVGGLVGAAAGAGTDKTRHFSDLVRDAVANGHAVLIAYAADEEQTTRAQAAITATLKEEAGRV